MAQSNNEVVTVNCYYNEVPDFVEHEIERLYSQPFSSLRYFRTHGGLPPQLCTFVGRRNDRIAAIFLFQREGKRISVLNEGMSLDAEMLACFARHVFAAYPAVTLISLRANRAAALVLPFPSQSQVCSEDIVAVLPASREAYLAGLGKSTRSYLRRYENKLRRSFPSFTFTVYEKAEVREEHVVAIARMNRERMAGKGKVSSNDENEAARIYALARECGMVCVATIDGRVCAGVIHYRFGSHFFMPVIAHDARYNDFRLGTICCFLSICESIARGCTEYHFMWGKYDYKYRLGGVQHDLAHLLVYRSRGAILANAGTAAMTAAAGATRRARRTVEDWARQSDQGGAVAGAAAKLIDGLRGIKRWMGRLKQA